MTKYGMILSLIVLTVLLMTAFTSAHAGDSVKDKIKDASAYVHESESLLMDIAYKESRFNPEAYNRRSGAQGLYQFIGSTWRYMVVTYGDAYGLTLDGRTDPYMAAIGAGLLVKEYRIRLQRVLGRKVDNKEIYLAYFAGPSRAIAMIRADDGTPIEDVLSGAAIRANPNLEGLTVGQAISTITKGINNE